MAETPKRIFIKPAMVDVGRGPQLATIPYPSAVGGRLRVLPPEGAEVSLDGADGSYWRRMIVNKSVEVVEAGKPAEPSKAERSNRKGDEQ